MSSADVRERIAASTQPVEPVDPWPDPVKSADRVLRLLDFLADSGPRPVGQIARELGLPLSSAHKLLKTVQRRNYIDYDADTRTYRLGWRIWQLSRAYAGVNDLVDKARPLMQRIVDAVGESVNLARLEGTDCVYLAFVESPYGARRVVAVGERFPANASAVGKVLLAALDEDDLRRRLSGTRLRRFTQRTITDVEELIETPQDRPDPRLCHVEGRAAAGPLYGRDAHPRLEPPGRRRDVGVTAFGAVERPLRAPNPSGAAIGRVRPVPSTRFDGGSRRRSRSRSPTSSGKRSSTLRRPRPGRLTVGRDRVAAGARTSPD